MTLSGSDLQAVLQNVLKKLDLFIFIKICIYLFVCMTMSMTLSGSDLQGDCPDHTQTYCYGCKSAYTQCKSAQVHTVQAHKHTQCKQCKICSTHLYPHCPDHTLSGRHLHKQSFRAAFHWCTAFQGCSELSFSLDSHSALLFTTLCLAFH